MPGKIQIGYQEEFLHGKVGKALEWAVQGGGGVTVPGGVRGMTGHCTWGCGRVEGVVFGRGLDFMILKADLFQP